MPSCYTVNTRACINSSPEGAAAAYSIFAQLLNSQGYANTVYCVAPSTSTATLLSAEEYLIGLRALVNNSDVYFAAVAAIQLALSRYASKLCSIHGKTCPQDIFCLYNASNITGQTPASAVLAASIAYLDSLPPCPCLPECIKITPLSLLLLVNIALIPLYQTLAPEDLEALNTFIFVAQSQNFACFATQLLHCLLKGKRAPCVPGSALACGPCYEESEDEESECEESEDEDEDEDEVKVHVKHRHGKKQSHASHA
jgi:hypothetical protein